MNTPQKRLEWWINERYHTKAEFCRDLGIDTTLLHRYIGSGKKSIFGNKFRKKLINLGLNYEWYVTGEGAPNTMPIVHAKPFPGEVVKSNEVSNVFETLLPDGLFVRFVNRFANAGEGFNFEDEPELLMNIQRRYKPESHIALKIKGDSMSPEISDMSTIIVDITKSPQPNDIVLALVDGVMLCKRYVSRDDKKILISDNPKYDKPIIINGVTHVEIKGVVVEAYKKWA